MGPRGVIEQFSGPDQRGAVFNRRVVVRLLAYLRPSAPMLCFSLPCSSSPP
jgi:hypothetical protein